MNKSAENFKRMILKGGYNRICNAVSIIKLRPNDQRTLLGEEGYNNFKEAVEQVLKENYYNNELLNKYYNEYDKASHGWMNFNRWLKYGISI